MCRLYRRRFSVYLAQKDRRVIFDAGGDPTGAGVLGRYHRWLEEDDTQVLCVVNTLRPWTATVDDTFG